jgi:acetaldehyde dehydrogenase / alcohol dehydrogenase
MSHTITGHRLGWFGHSRRSRPPTVSDELNEVFGRAEFARRALLSWTEAQVDALVDKVATGFAAYAAHFARLAVAETGMGVVEDKTTKNLFASLTVADYMRDRPGVGMRRQDAGLVEFAEPVGVVLGILPATNPVATLIFKALICLKSRNALVVRGHRRAKGVTAAVIELIRRMLREHGASDDLVQSLPAAGNRSVTAAAMRHTMVSLILATGGEALVRAAHESGTAAIGVGAGNAPVLVAEDADLVRAAQLVVASKSFDNGIICGSENNLVVLESVRATFETALERAGAAVLSPRELRRLMAVAFDAAGALPASVLGQPAAAIAAAARISRPYPIRILVAPTTPDSLLGPLGREKLAPIVSLLGAATEEDALCLCERILTNSGAGHTAIVHSRDSELCLRFARRVKASRVLVNAPGAQGCIGIGNGLAPSLTLGCGTWGGGLVTDNVNYTHLFNIKRIT